MVSTLERRVSRLEQSGLGGGDNCPRCRNTQITIDCSGNISVTKDTVRLTREAAERFYLEEQPGDRCPVCEKQRRRVRVGWSSESLRRGAKPEGRSGR